jgi:hypothetical protein
VFVRAPPAGAAAAAAASRAGRVGVHMVPLGRYCARVNSVQAFGEVNRDVSMQRRETTRQLRGVTLMQTCPPQPQ